MKRLFFVLFVLIGGCASSTPSRFFQLSYQGPVSAVEAKPKLLLGIGPISIPEYLNKPQIARRTTPVEVTYNEFLRWGEDLEDSIPRYLAQAIEAKNNEIEVQLYPFRTASRVTLQVSGRINRFEYVSFENQAVMSINYDIERAENRNISASNSFERAEKLGEGSGIEREVASLQSLLDALADDILAHLP